MEYTVNPDGTITQTLNGKPIIMDLPELSEDWIEYDDHKLFK